MHPLLFFFFFFCCIVRVTLLVLSFVPSPPPASWQEIVKYSAPPWYTVIDEASLRKNRPLIPSRRGLDVSFSKCNCVCYRVYVYAHICESEIRFMTGTLVHQRDGLFFRSPQKQACFLSYLGRIRWPHSFENGLSKRDGIPGGAVVKN